MSEIEIFYDFLYLEPFNCVQTKECYLALLGLHITTWNYLRVGKQMSSISFKTYVATWEVLQFLPSIDLGHSSNE